LASMTPAADTIQVRKTSASMNGSLIDNGNR
jgi:hypothetical protein